MKWWFKNLLIIIFFGCSSSQCGNEYYRIVKDIDFTISPNPIKVVNDKIEFDLIAKFPPYKYNPKLDSICYEFLVKSTNDKYLELAKSCHIMYDSIHWKEIIRQEDNIKVLFEMNEDTTNLYIQYKLYKNGQHLRYEKFAIALLFKSD